MKDKHVRLLVLNAALILLAALVTGMLYGQVVVAELRHVPSPVPGDLRGWHMAHLECLLNALLMLAVAAVARPMRLSARLSAVLAWGLWVCGWTNAIASTLSPLTGGRGAEYTGLDWNSLNHVLFIAGVLGFAVAAVALVMAAWRQPIATA